MKKRKLQYDAETGYGIVEQRNKMVVGDEIEVIGPATPYFSQILDEMYDQDGNPIEAAPHPQQIVTIKFTEPVGPNFM